MKWKGLSAVVLALALATSATAQAAGLPEGASWYGLRPTAEEVTTPVGDRYLATVTVNGKALEPVTFYNYDPVTYAETEVTMEVSDLPGAPAGYVPMRLLCAADPNGYSSWIAEENSAVFSFHKNSFIVYFDDLCVKGEEGAIPGVKAYLSEGVTFLPVTFLATLPGVEVEDHPELSVERYDFTLVVSPLVALADTIKAQAGSAAEFELTAEDLAMVYEVPAEAIQELVAYAPMMTSPDTVFLAKVPAGEQEAVKTAFEAYIQRQVETFSWYLTQHLSKAENGKVYTEGDYMMLFIGEDNAKAEELFRQGIKGM